MPFDENDLHLVFGESAGGTVIQATRARPDDFVVFIDPMGWGPLTAVERRAEWNRLRADYWNIPEQGADMLARLEMARDRIDSAPALRVWAGLELSERLFVAWLIAAFRLLGLPLEKLWLIHESQFPPDRPYMGFIPPDMAESWERWRPLDAAGQQPFDAMWQAITAPTPDGLNDVANPDSAYPGWARDSMHAFKMHYPATESGLGKWDRLLLQSCRQNAPDAVRTVAQVLCRDSKAETRYPDFVGDVVLFERLKAMGDPALPHPLVEATGDLSAMATTRITLTDAGADVLDGKANAIALNGIEERIGGVTLSSRAGNVWLFDGEMLAPA